jgi:hypothetical protein
MVMDAPSMVMDMRPGNLKSVPTGLISAALVMGFKARVAVRMVAVHLAQRRDAENGNRDIALPIPKSVGDDVRSLILKIPQSAIASPKLK